MRLRAAFRSSATVGDWDAACALLCASAWSRRATAIFRLGLSFRQLLSSPSSCVSPNTVHHSCLGVPSAGLAICQPGSVFQLTGMSVIAGRL
jgi:hypothetical protein